MRKIYILLPAYNESSSLPRLLPKIADAMSDQDWNYEIIACNDGSSDDTRSIFLQFKKTMPIRLIDHWINRGLGETVRDLFEAVSKECDDDDVIVRFDCDDTHEPSVIRKLVARLDEGFDVVTASRFAKGGGQMGVSAYRSFVSLMANWIMKLVFPIKGIREYSCAYRAYRGSLVKRAIRVFGNDFIQLKGMGFTGSVEKLVKLKMLGARFAEVGFVLRYDQKQSDSKMVTSVTALGYFVLLMLYHWPWGGWRRSKFFDT